MAAIKKLMKPYKKLAETVTPEGEPLELFEHDGEFFISSHGERLMTSVAHGSEEELARMACQPFRPARQPKVLVGGLGMGFTLAAAVESLPQQGASFVVAELTQGVLEWNQTYLKGIHPGLLDDPRVEVKVNPVQELIAKATPGEYSVIMLDVDNGPSAFHGEQNESLYTLKGLEAAKAALKEGGILAVWSAYPDKKFTKLLRKAKYDVSEVEVPAAHKGRKRRMHTIWLAKNGAYVSQNKPTRRSR
ncbi:polyamine aminopropyltransferase [Rubritalea halochordaticola]|uniref:Polyamine aminopropyltransferase n=1 Tax=Rubritalea halochordaticola TaxID=714537 RepID=A0ABP9UWV3_9BACT